jgi:tetratricopeptide (TPR) repeat protein
VRAINEAKTLVLVLSQSAVGSSHVGREIERAASKHKQIIALRIDTAPLTPALEYFLSESQWIDVPALGMPVALSRLSESIGQAFAAASSVIGAAGSGSANHVSLKGSRSGRSSTRVVVAAVVLVGMAISVGLAIHFWPMKGPAVAAATLAPGNVDVLLGEATLSATLGRRDDALRQSKAAVGQDPLDADLLQSLSGAQEAHGNLREAEAAMRRAMDIRPTYAYGHYNLALIFLERGDHDGALREIQQETIDDGRQEGLALAYFALGRKVDADAALAILIKEQADGNALDIAQVYAFRGQFDEAMHWLERAYAQKDPWLFAIKGGWLMKGLEEDPRYKVFLKKMNFPD